MADGVTSYMTMFADDTKIMRRVLNKEDYAALGQDLVRIYKWSNKWEMPLNTKICSVLEFGKSNRRVSWNYTVVNEPIMKKIKKKIWE